MDSLRFRAVFAVIMASLMALLMSGGMTQRHQRALSGTLR